MARNRFKAVAKDSAKKTNAELASAITDLTPVTSEKLKEMLPTKGDKQKFAELMEIVSASTSSNAKLKELKDNIDRLGPVVIKALGLLT